MKLLLQNPQKNYAAYTLATRLNHVWNKIFFIENVLLFYAMTLKHRACFYLGVPVFKDSQIFYGLNILFYVLGGMVLIPIKNMLKLVLEMPLYAVESVLEHASDRIANSELPWIVKGMTQSILHLGLALIVLPRLIISFVLAPINFIGHIIEYISKQVKKNRQITFNEALSINAHPTFRMPTVDARVTTAPSLRHSRQTKKADPIKTSSTTTSRGGLFTAFATRKATSGSSVPSPTQ